MTNESISVLFVCSGNICRSPTAEGVFRHLVSTEGLEDSIFVDSAGCHNYHAGESPDPRSQDAALARGYDLSDQVSRMIKPRDYETFDYILAMDRSNFNFLSSNAPKKHAEKIEMFLKYAPKIRTKEVPDPYYDSVRGFDLVLDMIEVASAGLLQSIMEKHF